MVATDLQKEEEEEEEDTENMIPSAAHACIILYHMMQFKFIHIRFRIHFGKQ